MDVVKTRIQLDPIKYNQGMVGGFRQVIGAEGAGALLTGLGATAGGYFVQGWFKFGGVEFFKITMAQALGEEKAWENRTAIYLAAAAGAEFIADLFLCPLEAVRIRAVSDKSFPQSLPGGFSRIISTEGVLGFYAGLGPILFKQVPYTMAKFAVQGRAADAIYASMGKTVRATFTDAPRRAAVLLHSKTCLSCRLLTRHLHLAPPAISRLRMPLLSLSCLS